MKPIDGKTKANDGQQQFHAYKLKNNDILCHF